MINIKPICAHIRHCLEKISAQQPPECPDLFRDFPRGCCKISSFLVMYYLAEFKGVPKNIMTLYANANIGSEKHAWVKYGDLHIDITGDQFGKPKLVIASDDPWPDSSPTRHPFDQERFNRIYEADLITICKHIYSQESDPKTEIHK